MPGGYSTDLRRPDAQRIAKLSGRQRALDPWNPNSDFTVARRPRRQRRVYLGGDFKHIVGLPRHRYREFPQAPERPTRAWVPERERHS
jgi:hypothetical protein